MFKLFVDGVEFAEGVGMRGPDLPDLDPCGAGVCGSAHGGGEGHGSRTGGKEGATGWGGKRLAHLLTGSRNPCGPVNIPVPGRLGRAPPSVRGRFSRQG